MILGTTTSQCLTCQERSQLCSAVKYMLLRYLLLFATCSFSIPFSMKHEEETSGFGIRNMKMVLLEPDDNILTGDQLCARYHRPWYRKVQEQRQELYEKFSGGIYKPRKIDPVIFGTPFTSYPNADHPLLDVPVEAIIGEPFGPRPAADWRKSYYGCWLTCQDIRKSVV